MFKQRRLDLARPNAFAVPFDIGCIDHAALDEADEGQLNTRPAHRNAMCQERRADWCDGGTQLGEGEKNGELINQSTLVSDVEARKGL